MTKQPQVKIHLSQVLHFFLLHSFKLKPLKHQGCIHKRIISWLMILMSDLEFQLFSWYQKACHAILTYVALDELIVLLFISKCF